MLTRIKNKFKFRQTGILYNFKKKLKVSKKTELVLILAFCIVLISTFYFTNTFSIKTKIHNAFGDYTVAVPSVDIDHNKDNPGGYHIEKSAKWTGSGTARVTFDLSSKIKTEDNYKDIVIVLDISGSMSGKKLEKAKEDAKDLVNTVLSDNHNKIALITFETNSTIESNLTNDKNSLISKIDSLTAAGCTNYYKALLNVDMVLNNYQKESNRDLVTLFMTDGYPNEETPNEVGVYELLKDKYPYMAINGVQYEMGTDIIDEIKNITDNQWVADKDSLNNVLFEASIAPIVYENFKIEDYIDSSFEVLSEDDIKVPFGTVSLTTENGLQKVTWDSGNKYVTGSTYKMTIDLKLKNAYNEQEGYYPTNDHEKITSKLPDESTNTNNSTNTPVLKNYYKVTYDPNSPDSSCDLTSYVDEENHFIYQNVNKKTTTLSCDGYTFKGWQLEDDNIKLINDDVFVMPDKDVTIRGVWTKVSMEKNMDGTVHEKATLYKVLEKEGKLGTYAKEYTGNHQDSMNGTGNKKIYHWYGIGNTNPNETTINNTIQNMNNVYFAGHCWKMLRTTDTGGVKLIYNGEYDETNKCNSSRGTHIGYAARKSQSLNSNYYYGTDYTYDSVNKKFSISGTTEVARYSSSTIDDLIGKYTCKSATEDGTCSTLYLVESYYSTSSAYVIPINSNSHYSQFGSLQFNVNSSSPAYVGYMYNYVYTYNAKTVSSGGEQDLGIEKKEMTNGSKYYYGDNVTYKAGKYYLTNPTEMEWNSSNLNTINGKYTCLSDDTSTYNEYSNYSPIPQLEYTNITNDNTYPYTYNSSTNMWKSANQGKDRSADTIEFSVTDSGSYKLNYVVSSEKNYDKATFYKDGTSLGTFSGEASGEIDLGELTSSNVIKVSYSKDSSSARGTDTVSFNLLKGNPIEHIEAERCNNAYYVLNTTKDNGYMYTEKLVNENTTPYKKIKIGDTYSSGTLSNAQDVAFEDYYNNYNNYIGKYYCNDLSSTSCSASNARYIKSTTNTKISYVPSDSVYSYGNSFKYENNKYILSDTTIDGADNTHHYTCFNTTGKCTNLYYIYYISGSTSYYITLKDGDSIEDAKNKMLYNEDVNQINSTIKTGVDAWYKRYMLKYDSYIEDTIFCNDRTQSNESANGWNPNGGSLSTYMNFKNDSTITDLSCTNITDRFSTLNNKAKLTYKVGLFSAPEMNILTNNYIKKTGQYYWLSSPFSFSIYDAFGRTVHSAGFMNDNDRSVNSTRGVRPAVSLKPGTEYKDGDGSMNMPYIVDTGD